MSRRRPARPFRRTVVSVAAVLAALAAGPAAAQQQGAPTQTQQRPAQTQTQPPQQQRPPQGQQPQRPTQPPQQQRPAQAPAQPPAPAPPQRPAQPPPMQVVGEFGDWAVYSIQEQGGRLCFMTSRPRSSTPATVRRGEIRLMVTHWPSEQTFDEVNFVPGFNFRDASDVTVQIGNDRFSLFTQGDKAWARDAETDRRIVEALRKGARVVVTAVSERGTTTTDTFGLNGSNRAYEEMSRACNVRR
jgi:hypothetical protein